MPLPNLFSLSGRTALVTGASRGIGRAIAEALAAHGARVVCAARTERDLGEVTGAIQAAGGQAKPVLMDVEDSASLPAAAKAAAGCFGPIDILVNNAGVNFREPATAVSHEHFERIVGINLEGLFFLTREVARDMISRRSGKIINIGSITTAMGLSQLAIYSATKGAVGQMTKSLAAEFGRHNIQVNALCPGFVITPLTTKLWAMPHMQEWAQNRIPAGRLAKPEDLVGAAVFLASPASDYVTGHSLYVDGGYTVADPWPIPVDGGNAAPPGEIKG
jgi:NAD(P)-dependent dehydrogenase (short-subunit alcohol dehydrogenase family)